eukprot:scaffold2684_cov124-Isochrysis_galbana.AAC.9
MESGERQRAARQPAASAGRRPRGRAQLAACGMRAGIAQCAHMCAAARTCAQRFDTLTHSFVRADTLGACLRAPSRSRSSRSRAT